MLSCTGEWMQADDRHTVPLVSSMGDAEQHQAAGPRAANLSAPPMPGWPVPPASLMGAE